MVAGNIGQQNASIHFLLCSMQCGGYAHRNPRLAKPEKQHEQPGPLEQEGGKPESTETRCGYAEPSFA